MTTIKTERTPNASTFNTIISNNRTSKACFPTYNIANGSWQVKCT